ncbi:MAG TPA: class I SAM-dependent methyltransferase [Actinomycetota bacterium]
MDPKTLNALVHDREAAFYDDRFLIDYDGRIGREVSRDLRRLTGETLRVKRALDLACGTGYAAIGLAIAEIADEVHGCDLSREMLRRTRDNAAAAGTVVRALASDAELLPYRDGCFDLVIARGALHHVPDPLAALREMRRVLAPGGVAVVIAEPTASGERQVGAVVGSLVRVVESARRLRGRQQTADEAEHRHWELASIAANLHTFAPEEIATLAEKAGFEDITVGTASWAWILALGVNYYLVGEFERLARSRTVRRAARALAGAGAAFDRAVADRFLPPGLRHTVQGVFR